MGEERIVSMANAMVEAFRRGRDQDKSGEWKWMPRTMPEVVGPKDLSK